MEAIYVSVANIDFTNKFDKFDTVWYETFDEIEQTGRCSFSLCCYERDDILNWLLNDCVWDFKIASKLEKRFFGRYSYLKFNDYRGAIEFKLRFM
jgi:hypothetical protein